MTDGERSAPADHGLRSARARSWERAGTAASIIAAVATVIATAFAFSAATAASDSAEAARAMNELSIAASRPYLSLEEVGYDLTSADAANVTLVVQNVGQRAASNVSSRTTVLHPVRPGEDMAYGVLDPSGTFRFTGLADSERSLANDLAPQQRRQILPRQIPSSPDATFLVVSLSYEDSGAQHRLPVQRFYYAIGPQGILEADGTQRDALRAYFEVITRDS